MSKFSLQDNLQINGFQLLAKTLAYKMLLTIRYMEKCQILPPFWFLNMTKTRLFLNSLCLLHPKLFSFCLLATDSVLFYNSILKTQVMKTICLLGNIFRSTAATYSLPTNLTTPTDNTVKGHNKDTRSFHHFN